MARIVYKCIYSVIVGLLLITMVAACGDDDGDETELDPPLLVSSTFEDGASDIAVGDMTISLTFDQNVFCPSSGHSSITLGDATINNILVRLSVITIEVSGLVAGTEYTLMIPVGVIQGPTYVSNEAFSISFSTIEETSVDIDVELVTANAMLQTQNVYAYLLDQYGEYALAATMSNVAWNINEAEWVNQHTGKYPAMTTFDYIHLPFSPANWIDYSDISVLKDWWSNNGLIAAGWHWIVPKYEGASGTDAYTYKPTETTFDVNNALIEGTWENNFIIADLEKMAGYLKLLQDEGIPVIWRPLHEAAGNTYEYADGTAWFWWGYDGADAYKNLWHYMFDYFEKYGLNNLIWVWTTQTGDNAFYPGDDYVDIVGRDIYNNSSASSIAEQFAEIQDTYSNKMITLSEFGSVANFSDLWSSGARWSYFMPWYDYDRTESISGADFSETDHEHANISWWSDAMSNNAVISRDEMPSLK